MIPLIKPLFPSQDSIGSWFSGCYSSGIWSNFGEIHDRATAAVKKITGGFPVLVSSGMKAIQVALEVIGVDENIAVPDYSHAGSLLPIVHSNRFPIIVACDPQTRAIDLDTFELLCSGGDIDGAVIVNPFGRGIDRRAYSDIARNYGVQIVYDYAGAWEDFRFDDEFPTVYSLHATKSMPIGEGGIIVFQNELDAANAKRFINFGTGPDRLIHQLGFNAKLSEISAAVLCAQLEWPHYEKVINRIFHRSELQRIYSAVLEGKPYEYNGMFSLSLCTVCLPGVDIDLLEKKAAELGFTAKQYYIPLRSMPAFFNEYQMIGDFHDDLDHCLGLPSDVSIEEAQGIADSLRSIAEDLRT